MRLIDADDLMEALNKSDRDARTEADIQGYCDGWNDVVEIINDQPTAYDVDTVVAELEEERFPTHENYSAIWLDKATTIVKRVGAE